MGLRRLQVLAPLVVVTLTLSMTPAMASRAHHASPRAAITWTFGAASPVAWTRFDGQYDPATKRIYFLGFRDITNSTDGSVWYYDTVSATYTDTGVDMPVPVSNYQISALTDAKGLGFFIFGGRDNVGNIVTTVQVYRPALNKATVVASDPWPGQTPAACVSLPGMGVATVANHAVVLGGMSFSSSGCIDDNSAQTWIYDPVAPAGARWTQGPDLNVARGYITPAVVGQKIYAIGGDTNVAGNPTPTATVEGWKFGGPAWSDAGVADLPEVCDESQAFALSTVIVMAGCGQWPSGLADTNVYDLATNTWSAAGPLNDNRRNHAGAIFKSGRRLVMFVFGGYGAASQFIDPIDTSETATGRSALSGAPASRDGSVAAQGVATN
jgi:hypothetical protein